VDNVNSKKILNGQIKSSGVRQLHEIFFQECDIHCIAIVWGVDSTELDTILFQIIEPKKILIRLLISFISLFHVLCMHVRYKSDIFKIRIGDMKRNYDLM
jgi:hypothetical protein